MSQTIETMRPDEVNPASNFIVMDTVAAITAVGSGSGAALAPASPPAGANSSSSGVALLGIRFN